MSALRLRGKVRTEKILRALVLRYRSQVFFKGELRLEFHQNTCTMVSLARKGRCYRLRMHQRFASAPPEVLEAVVQCFFARLSHKQIRVCRECIFDYLEKHQLAVVEDPSSIRLLKPRGKVYDLAAMQTRLRRRFLPHCPALRIGWAPRVTSRLMAKWMATPEGSRNVILVNPLLDSARVPSYYVRYIVFHELLHEVIPIRREHGRWLHHPVEFRRREQEFPYFEQAVRWERENVSKLFDAHVRRSGDG